ncbi:MSC_0619 family F1-like ATPase alpha subunit [Mycoplasma miroungirhinis]|uniref:ATP F0F1 synthase subunit alpha n=1 Tax=Mycoplasma miroungirhinis TaxID=754516 RepID=A0A6M4JDP0_9MOLU|nr:ATP F0F1 synthase subunit alpha [Mycoplasma miroungirhinis]QJR44186.1 ATP F0F1 synthase subunit alpha [Mycoplasma miroungirhinis]
MKNNTNLKNPKITAIFDYIVEVSGEFEYKQKQMFKAKNHPNVNLILINGSKDKALLLSNDKSSSLSIGDEIELVETTFNVYTDEKYFGKIIDIAGNVINPEFISKPSFDEKQTSSPIFKLAHDLMSVQTLNEQLYTGINVIDLLIPIGKGQRQLIIGDRQTGKTHIALNTIINQTNKNVKCIYVAIGQKRDNISTIYQTLKQHNALKNTIIIEADSNSVYDQYLAPYVGMAHAENISQKNDVLIIFDDLTKHANIFREIALLSESPVGKEAMPGDIFFAHSQLLERAGNFKNKKTITALPILQTIDGDITSLISSNIISITDGQIVTSSDMFNAGKLPAINIDLSVSRTGSSVQDIKITKVASEINKIYRKYRRQLKLASLDYDFNYETTQLIYKGKMIEKMFFQRGISVYSEKLILLTSKIITWGLFSGIKDDAKAMKFIDLLIQTDKQAQELYNAILNNTTYDDKLTKNYFAFALKQYANFINIDWNIKIDNKFIEFDNEYLTTIAKKLGDI